ncbi:MAG: Lipoprotein signal peptidase [Chlamydiae bacterium]|nr:Lipoprotein signal peptidase [Chlamydiota bacterium]
MRWVLLFIGVFALDFLSKQLVDAFLPMIQWGAAFPYGGISIFNHFLGMSCALVHTTNTGAAWGLFSSFSYILVALRLVAGAFLIWKAVQEPARRLPFLLIAAGAIGNAVDAFRFGHVVDMILLKFGSYTYPVFNIADSSICVGVGLLILKLALRRHESASAH